MSTAYLLQAMEIAITKGLASHLTYNRQGINLNYYSVFLLRVFGQLLAQMMRYDRTIHSRVHPTNLHLPAIKLHPFAVTQQHI